LFKNSQKYSQIKVHHPLLTLVANLPPNQWQFATGIIDTGDKFAMVAAQLFFFNPQPQVCKSANPQISFG
jgi:hypothetical protein